MKLPRYPLYVISKGRWDEKARLTVKFLQKDGVPFRLVVEETEAEHYEEAVKGGGEMVVLPFHDLGQGGIPARNFVWEHARETGAARHWILDDNIWRIHRFWKGKRIPCDSGPAFAAIEDFTDRYENIAIAGMNYHMFAIPGSITKPFHLNAHVYSLMLIRNDLPYRWRGRYNEDTDLCLQVLSGGWCTVLVNAFLAFKVPSMTMKGGNTDKLYAGDGRLKMARSLERVWPGVVTVGRRYGRPQHVVNWRKFRQPLIRREDVDLDALPDADEYGYQLVAGDRQLAKNKQPNRAGFTAPHLRNGPGADVS